MANRHLLTTISAIATAFIVIFAALWWFEPILFFAMGIYAYSTSYMFMKVFRKYRPEMDSEDFAMNPLPMLNLDDETSPNTALDNTTDTESIPEEEGEN